MFILGRKPFLQLQSTAMTSGRLSMSNPENILDGARFPLFRVRQSLLNSSQATWHNFLWVCLEPALLQTTTEHSKPGEANITRLFVY